MAITLPGEEVKNRDAIGARLPSESVALLDCYLERFRPLLAALGNRWLFPSGRRRDHHKSPEALTDQLQNLVWERTGLKVNPHLYRHLAVKLFCEANPGGQEVMRLVLGHRDIQTTIDSYTGTEGAAATAHYDSAILALRHTLGGEHAR